MTSNETVAAKKIDLNSHWVEDFALLTVGIGVVLSAIYLFLPGNVQAQLPGVLVIPATLFLVSVFTPVLVIARGRKTIWWDKSSNRLQVGRTIISVEDAALVSQNALGGKGVALFKMLLTAPKIPSVPITSKRGTFPPRPWKPEELDTLTELVEAVGSETQVRSFRENWLPVLRAN